MKKIILSILIFSAYILSAYNPMSEFNKGVDFYTKEEYSKAAVVFDKLIEEGYKTFEVYYNLGNCYYREDKVALAILNYERAKKLEPNNEDVDLNLKLANLKIVDKYDALPKLFIFEWYDAVRNLFNSCLWAKILISFVWILSLLVAGLMLFSNYTFRKYAVLGGIISIIAIVISGFMAYQSNKSENSKEYAIVFSPSVYIKSSPDNNSADLFILHEGTKVRILDELSDWCEIRIDNGNVGWLQKKNIVEI